MSWIPDDELHELRTHARQYRKENYELKNDIKRAGLLALAALKLVRGLDIPEKNKLLDDSLLLILERCTGYKKELTELLLDITPSDYIGRPPDDETSPE